LGSNPTVTASFESRFSLIHSAETGLVSFEFGSIVATVSPFDLGSRSTPRFCRVAAARATTRPAA